MTIVLIFYRDGHGGTIMGWGETEDDDSQQDELGWIQLSVYGKDICNREYQDLKDGKVRNVGTIIHVNKIDEKMPEQFQSNIYCANAFVSTINYYLQKHERYQFLNFKKSYYSLTTMVLVKEILEVQ